MSLSRRATVSGRFSPSNIPSPFQKYSRWPSPSHIILLSAHEIGCLVFCFFKKIESQKYEVGRKERIHNWKTANRNRTKATAAKPSCLHMLKDEVCLQFHRFIFSIIVTDVVLLEWNLCLFLNSNGSVTLFTVQYFAVKGVRDFNTYYCYQIFLGSIRYIIHVSECYCYWEISQLCYLDTQST